MDLMYVIGRKLLAEKRARGNAVPEGFVRLEPGLGRVHDGRRHHGEIRLFFGGPVSQGGGTSARRRGRSGLRGGRRRSRG